MLHGASVLNESHSHRRADIRRIFSDKPDDNSFLLQLFTVFIFNGEVKLFVTCRHTCNIQRNPAIPPAVPPNDCLFRISLMATHTEQNITFALEKIEKVGRECGVI